MLSTPLVLLVLLCSENISTLSLDYRMLKLKRLGKAVVDEFSFPFLPRSLLCCVRH